MLDQPIPARTSASTAIALLAASVVVVSLACQAPTPAVSPAAGPAPTLAAASSPTAAAARPAVPQRLNIALTGVGGDTDPYTDTAPASYFKSMVQERLTETVTRGTPELGQLSLAETYRVIDPTTWEFKLRPGVRFSNGQPVTAADVKASFERALDPQKAYPSAQANAAVSITGAEAVDTTTVRIRTRAADPVLLARVAVIGIAPAGSFDRAATDATASLGSGPFKYASFTPRQSVVLVPNEQHTRTRPVLTEIAYRELPEAATRMAALRTGEVQLIQSVTLASLGELAGANARPVGAQLPFVQVLNFDSSLPELASKSVRIGLNYAIDRQEVIKQILGGLAEPASQAAPRFVFGYNPELAPYGYDPARARQALAEAGYPNGFSIKGTYPFTLNYRDVAQASLGYLQRVGVRVDMEEIDLAKYLELSRDRRLPAVYLHALLSSLGNDPVGALRIFRSVPNQPSRYNNPEFDRIHDQQLTELDPQRRQALLRQAMKLLYDDPPVIYLWTLVDVWGVSERVSGMDTLATQTPPFWAVFMKS